MVLSSLGRGPVSLPFICRGSVRIGNAILLNNGVRRSLLMLLDHPFCDLVR